jgi:hypothetical protein
VQIAVDKDVLRSDILMPPIYAMSRRNHKENEMRLPMVSITTLLRIALHVVNTIESSGKI